MQEHEIVACSQLERETFVVKNPMSESAKVGDEIDLREPGNSYCVFPAGTRIKYKVKTQVKFCIVILYLLSSKDLPLRSWRVKSSDVLYKLNCGCGIVDEK